VVRWVRHRSRGRLQAGCEVFHSLKKTLHDRGLARRLRRAVASRPTSVERAGAADAGRRIEPRATGRARPWRLPWIPPTSEIYKGAAYELEHEDRTLSSAELATTGDLAPAIRSSRSEDGMTRRLGRLEGADDRIGTGVQLVGDDSVRHQHGAMQRGIDAGVANSILGEGEPDRHADRDARARDTAREAGYTP